jgi:hypothetical protein
VRVVVGGQPVDLGWVEHTLDETTAVLAEPPA